MGNSQHNGILISTSFLLFIVTSKIVSVKHVRKTSAVSTNLANVTPGPLLSRENLSSENGKSGQHIKNNVMVDDLKSKVKAPGNDHTKTSDSDVRNNKENGGLKKGIQHADAVAFTGLPTEVYVNIYA